MKNARKSVIDNAMQLQKMQYVIKQMHNLHLSLILKSFRLMFTIPVPKLGMPLQVENGAFPIP